jgi:hypothetical protein
MLLRRHPAVARMLRRNGSFRTGNNRKLLGMTAPAPPIGTPILANLAAGAFSFDEPALLRALAALPADAPVVVMIHGYRFQPGRDHRCPHRHILSAEPCVLDGRQISWPKHLELDGHKGLAIALGWPAGGTIWQAYAQAARAGLALADFAERFHQIAPGRALNIVAHSFGTRVALTALSRVKPGQIARMIFLSGAETRALAQEAMQSPAGRTAEVINVTSRENDLFDAAFEWLLHFGRHWSIGQGLGAAAPNWRDLWIDDRHCLHALAQSGFPLKAPSGRISHWAPYLRPGVFALYRALLRGEVPLTELPKAQPSRRWSLLFSRRPEWPATALPAQAAP